MEVNKRNNLLESAKLTFVDNYDRMMDMKETIVGILREENKVDNNFDYSYNEFCLLYLKSMEKLLKNDSVETYSDLDNATGAMFLYATVLEDVKLRKQNTL